MAALSYHLSESYNPLNFFSKFDFFVSKYGTGSSNDVDPSHGFVNYRDQAFAEVNGLIHTDLESVYIGVNYQDTFTPGSYGRDSIQLESKKSYNHGLFVWNVSHFPQATCGSWPAIWSYGPAWPVNGEMDIYENWNLATTNLITGHTNAPTAGSCTITQTDFSDTVVTPNCDYAAAGQYVGQGCSSTETAGQWSQPSGGIYAWEWTSDAISVWSWPPGAEPRDLACGRSEPSGWGLPHFQIEDQNCNIDEAFRNHTLVVNIDFCGDTAGNSGIWDNSACYSLNSTCEGYVGATPDAFRDVYWRINNIDIYQDYDLDAFRIRNELDIDVFNHFRGSTDIHDIEPLGFVV